MEPIWSGNRVQPGANTFQVLADNSEGMQIHDKGESQSRGDILKRALTDQKAGWRQKLQEFFQVQQYTFDSRLQPSSDYSDLNFKGRASAMASALKSLGTRFLGQPVAGILLFSDGNATDLHNNMDDFSKLPPVY